MRRCDRLFYYVYVRKERDTVEKGYESKTMKKNFIVLLTMLFITVYAMSGISSKGFISMAAEVTEENSQSADVPEETENPYSLENSKEQIGENCEEAKEIIGNGAETAVDVGKDVLDAGGDAVDAGVDAGANAVEEGTNSFWEGFYDIHTKIKVLTPLLFVGSIVLGLLVAVFARKNKGLRQSALIVFCITIPVVLLLLVYGLPYIRPLGNYATDTVMNEKAKLDVVQDTTSSKNAVGIYYDVLNRTQNADNVVQKEKDAYQIWNGYEHLNRMLKSHMVAIITGCEVFGMFIIVLARRDKSMKTWAGVSLCIALPLLLMAVVYLIPVIQKIFV